MGGSGSGRQRWWGRYTKTTTDECCILDINTMQRDGDLRLGVVTAWTWSRRRAAYKFGREQGNDYKIYTVGIHEGILIHGSVTTKERVPVYDYIVQIVWSPCNYGGKRPYFICPGSVNDIPCNRRVVKLYRPLYSHYFLCRHCLDLTYPSCNESGDTHYTARRRTERIARKLGIAEPMDVYTMRRPKGMHRKTFEKLKSGVQKAHDNEMWAFYDIIMKKF